VSRIQWIVCVFLVGLACGTTRQPPPSQPDPAVASADPMDAAAPSRAAVAQWRRVTSATGLFSVEFPDGWTSRDVGPGMLDVHSPDASGEITVTAQYVEDPQPDEPPTFTLENVTSTMTSALAEAGWTLASGWRQRTSGGQIAVEADVVDPVGRVGIFKALFTAHTLVTLSTIDRPASFDQRRDLYRHVADSLLLAR
jgi:hypothetical protein